MSEERTHSGGFALTELCVALAVFAVIASTVMITTVTCLNAYLKAETYRSISSTMLATAASLSPDSDGRAIYYTPAFSECDAEAAAYCLEVEKTVNEASFAGITVAETVFTLTLTGNGGEVLETAKTAFVRTE